jgi:arginyl-tRNA synthetase
MKEEEAEKKAGLMLEAQEMLRKWEANDREVRHLWEIMNGWVYEGFEETYRRLGVDFDKIYVESETWITGKETVLDGLQRKILVQHDDGSVWADLRDKGLDEKVLLRSDGTSVYMTQDIGTAQVRQNDYAPDKLVYVVGNEQNYHFKVLAIVLDMLGFPWAKSLHHLSYGMVELPEGKMKSREGTVVDADDLMDEMISTARGMSNELGKLEGLSEEEKKDIYRTIGLGALKYYMLKVDPVKNMVFNPRESIDFDGNTGPFIQYTYTRIRSIFRKAAEMEIREGESISETMVINGKEKNLLKLIHDFPEVISDSARTYNPSQIVNYIYDLVKEYNQFYHDYSILKEEDTEIRDFRLMLSRMISGIVHRGMDLLGIEMPERM